MKKKVQAIFLKIQYWSSFLPSNCGQIDKKRFLACALHTKQQKQNCCASGRLWPCSIWPNATSNQQLRGIGLCTKTIANSLYNFILVDCCLVTSFSNWVEITPPWLCWPLQLRFRDGTKSHPTDIGRINQVERKLKSDVTRSVLSIFVVVEIYWPNAMVDNHNDRLVVSLLLVVGCSTYLT
jgi:hypothetical protein